MSEHPAVAFLAAALARAEETARAATAGPWTADVGDETVRAEAGTVATMRDWHRVMPTAQVEADMALIVGQADPASVLRRVAADRQILAEHARVAWGVFCLRCAEDGGPERGPAAYPCRTVLLLAQAWGWEDLTGR